MHSAMAKAGRYDVVNSPYIELETPFTLWYSFMYRLSVLYKADAVRFGPLGQGPQVARQAAPMYCHMPNTCQCLHAAGKP